MNNEEREICACEDAALCGCGKSTNGEPHCMFCLLPLRPETTAAWSDFLCDEG